jgi:hypothetical protein
MKKLVPVICLALFAALPSVATAQLRSSDGGSRTIRSGQTLTIASGATLAIASGATMTNAGTLSSTGTLTSDALAGASATTLAVGNATSTAVSLCNSAACDTITIGTNTDADTITIGESNDTAVSITDNNWSISAGGIASFAHQRRVNGTTFTAADPNPSKATLQAADFFLVDTTSNAVDLDFADDAALDAADIGSTWTFIVSAGGTNALTVTAGASGVTTVTTHNATTGTTAEDVGDMIECTAYATTKIACVVYAAD